MTIAHPRPGLTAHDPTPTQRPPRALSRRSMMVRGAVVGAGLVTAGPLLAACTGTSGLSEETRIAQRFSQLSLDASTDASAARTLIARTPDRAAALAVVAAERQRHATVLNDEIARLAPDLARPSTASGVPDAPTSTAGSTSAPPTSSAPTAPAVTTVEQLRTRLQSATTSTGDLSVTLSGYRAGLLASIAASLSAEVEVQLA